MHIIPFIKTAILTSILGIYPWQRTYDTRKDAVYAIFNHIQYNYSDYKRIEYGGYIYYYEGKFRVSTPIKGDSQCVKLDFLVPKGGILIGTYHNHPHFHWCNHFSELDKLSSRKLGVKGYLLDSDDRVQMYDPLLDKTEWF
jgi:hypothetical protein